VASSVTVAIVGTNDLAKELGKKGTSSDVTLYNEVHNEHAATLVEPTQFPEKLPPLVQALAMADRCVLAVLELSRPVAEAIAVVELVDVPTTVVVGPSVGDAEVARLLKGSRLEHAPRRPLDLPHLRDELESWSAPTVEGDVEVPLDHAFPVKGVGAVALGVVRRGVLRAHDKLRLYPTPKDVEVRSVQVHDVDRKEAHCGERVGVSLKGVDADELGRGQVLAPSGSLADGSSVAGGPLERCRYYRGDAGVGARLHLALGLQVVPAVLERMEPGGVTVAPDRPVVWRPGAQALLLDLSVPAGPRLVGRFPVPR
jgi:selenocysteine-specific translation elongation factor